MNEQDNLSELVTCTTKNIKRNMNRSRLSTSRNESICISSSNRKLIKDETWQSRIKKEYKIRQLFWMF